MKRILVPTDFSPTAERALRFALDLAARIKATVILHHAYAPEKNEFVSTERNRENYNAQQEINLLKQLQRLSRKVSNSDNNSVPVSTIVGHTPVVDDILGFTEGNQVDMIIMGTHGVSGLRKTIIGSVASKVAENADVPVFLIPEKFELKDPGHMVFATSYDPSDKKALSLLIFIAAHYKADVTVVHLQSAYLNEGDKQKETSDFDTYAYYLKKDIDEPSVSFKLIETLSILETMESLDREISCDLLAMVRGKKGFYEKYFLGSFTKNMAYLTHFPLLIVPADTEAEEEAGDKMEKSFPAVNSELQIKRIKKPGQK